MNYVNVPSKSNKQKNLKIIFCLHILNVTDESAVSGSVSQRCGSKVPDSYQNVTDPDLHQNCLNQQKSLQSCNPHGLPVLGQ
jgi:hypothetical protein